MNIFPFVPRPRRAVEPSNVREVSLPARTTMTQEPKTSTAKNQNARKRRREAWWDASRQLVYWEARIDLWSAIRCVQVSELPEGDLHQEVHYSEFYALQARRNEALARRLLAPAYDALGVDWKRRLLANGKFKGSGLSVERVQRAIDEDEEFLASHPTRKNYLTRKKEQRGDQNERTS